jgi:hypothetical protein
MATKRMPAELTHAELVTLVDGLIDMMYADTEHDTEGDIETWNPALEFDFNILRAWVHQELETLGLVPEAGPRTYIAREAKP